MYVRHKTGKLGEDAVCNFLNKSKYQIVKRNFSCKLRRNRYYSKR